MFVQRTGLSRKPNCVGGSEKQERKQRGGILAKIFLNEREIGGGREEEG